MLKKKIAILLFVFPLMIMRLFCSNYKEIGEYIKNIPAFWPKVATVPERRKIIIYPKLFFGINNNKINRRN